MKTGVKNLYFPYLQHLQQSGLISTYMGSLLDHCFWLVSLAYTFPNISQASFMHQSSLAASVTAALYHHLQEYSEIAYDVLYLLQQSLRHPSSLWLCLAVSRWWSGH